MNVMGAHISHRHFNDQIVCAAERDRAFNRTEIGRALARYRNALVAECQVESREYASDRELQKAQDDAFEAERTLLTVLSREMNWRF